MKIIKLFLLFSFVLWADIKLDMPNIRSNTVDNVVKYGWKKVDNNLKVLFEEKGTNFIENFVKLSERPLKEQSDEEYLRKNILSYSVPSIIDPEEYGLPPKVDEEKHLKVLNLTIKYDLKYMKYKRIFERDTYNYLMAYIKLLENNKEFFKAYDLYIRVINRLFYIDNTLDITVLNGIRKIVFNSIVVNAVKESVAQKYYTKEQIDELARHLKMILMIDEHYWEQMMLEEKRVTLAYMKIAVIEVETFEEFIDGIEKEKLDDSEIFNNLDYSILKKYFEDKVVMEAALEIFSKKIDRYLLKLSDVKTHDDYLKLETEYKKYIEAYFEGFDKKIGENNKYKLSKQEFIDIASEVMYGYSKIWKMGKSKMDYVRTINENKKFIESLHN
jgi:hypothetical protein